MMRYLCCCVWLFLCVYYSYRALVFLRTVRLMFWWSILVLFSVCCCYDHRLVRCFCEKEILCNEREASVYEREESKQKLNWIEIEFSVFFFLLSMLFKNLLTNKHRGRCLFAAVVRWQQLRRRRQPTAANDSVNVALTHMSTHMYEIYFQPGSRLIIIIISWLTSKYSTALKNKHKQYCVWYDTK